MYRRRCRRFGNEGRREAAPFCSRRRSISWSPSPPDRRADGGYPYIGGLRPWGCGVNDTALSKVTRAIRGAEGKTCAQRPPTGTKKAAEWRLGLFVARVELEVGSFSDDGGVRKWGGAFGARPRDRPGPLRSAARRRRYRPLRSHQGGREERRGLRSVVSMGEGLEEAWGRLGPLLHPWWWPRGDSESREPPR
jgi:hypothetical protein